MHILVVDDEPDSRRYLMDVLANEHSVDGVADGSAAIAALGSGTYDLVLTDLNMPVPDGFAVLEAARRVTPPPVAAVVTAVDTAASAVRALKLGATDLLVKPATPDEIRELVARVEAERGEGKDFERKHFGLLGDSPAMRKIHRLIPLLARSRETVLIQGETGTGKELLARALHEEETSRERPFVTHNMAATPVELAESFFLGHVRGAFSGAVADHAGVFEQAHGGTLFLDEVDSFPAVLQAKLLRVLESGEVRRVGSTRERIVDVRVIVASVTNLERAVDQGLFRADLYYRLKQLEVVLPPLRERVEDIVLLAGHFLMEWSKRQGKHPQLTPPAMGALERYAFPGNVRELGNAVRSAAVLAGGGSIRPEHLPESIRRPVAAEPEGLAVSLLAVEHRHIRQMLQRVGGNRSRAARLLGIDRSTLLRKLRSLGGSSSRDEGRKER